MESLKVVSICLFGIHLGACGGNEAPRVDDDIAPVVHVTSPGRGAHLTGNITVTGKATDDQKLVGVVVNGVQATLQENGDFSAELSAQHGIMTIETRAIDHGGNEAVDVRAVMQGELEGIPEHMAESVAVRLSAETFMETSALAEDQLNAFDLEGVLLGMNPLVPGSGICPTRVTADSFAHGGFQAQLSPTDEGLEFEVIISSIQMEGEARFGCVFSPDFVLTIGRIVASGKLQIDANGEIEVSIVNIDSDIEDVDADGNFLVELGEAFVNIENKLQDALDDALQTTLPQTLENTLGAMAFQKTVQIAGHSVLVGYAPSGVDISNSGMTVVLDGGFSVPTELGVQYLASPKQLPEMGLDENLSDVGVLVSDDLLNAGLASVWSAGILNQEIDVPADSVLSFGGVVSKIRIEAGMPPYIAANGGPIVRLSVGELYVVGETADGQEAIRLVLSAKAGVVLNTSDEGISLGLTSSEVVHQIMDIDENLLLRDLIDAGVALLGSQLDTLLGDVLGNVTIPSLVGLTFGDLQVDSLSGHLRALGTVSYNPNP